MEVIEKSLQILLIFAEQVLISPLHYVILFVSLGFLFLVATICTCCRHCRIISCCYFGMCCKPIAFRTFQIKVNWIELLTKLNSTKVDANEQINSLPSAEPQKSNTNSQEKQPATITLIQKKRFFSIFNFSVGEVIVLASYGLFSLIFAVNALNVTLFSSSAYTSPSFYFSAVFNIIHNLLKLNFIFFLAAVPRNSIWVVIFGTSCERTLFYHKLINISTIMLVVAQGLLYLSWFCVFGDIKNNWLSIFQLSMIPADLAFVFFVVFGVISFTSTPKMLLNGLFPLFHAIVTFLALIFTFINSPVLFIHALPALILWGIDIIIRFSTIMKNRFKIVKVELIPGTDSVRITLKQNISKKEAKKWLADEDPRRNRRSICASFFRNCTKFNFSAGQWVFLNIPSVSLFEYHSVAIASAPSESELEFLIKICDKSGFGHNIQQNLKKLVGATAILEGPYGNPSVSEKHYRNLLLVSEDTGASAALSLIRQKILESKQKVLKILLENQPIDVETPPISAESRLSIPDFDSSCNSSSSSKFVKVQDLENSIFGNGGEKIGVEVELNIPARSDKKASGENNSNGGKLFKKASIIEDISKIKKEMNFEMEELRKQQVEKKISQLQSKKKRISLVWVVKNPQFLMNFKEVLLESTKEFPDLEFDLRLFCLSPREEIENLEFLDNPILDHVKFGAKPNLKEMMKEVLGNCPSRKNIGVKSCCSKDMSLELQRACFELNTIIFPRIHYESQNIAN